MSGSSPRRPPSDHSRTAENQGGCYGHVLQGDCPWPGGGGGGGGAGGGGGGGGGGGVVGGGWWGG